MKISSPSSLMDSIQPLRSSPQPHRTIIGVRVAPLPAAVTLPHITLPTSRVWPHVQNSLKTGTILLVIAAAGTLFYLSRTHHLFTITSGSMEPAIATGSIVAVPHQEIVPSYDIGDVITFASSRGVITHRIIEAVSADNGSAFRTQGDANEQADHDPVPQNSVIGPVALTIPYLGYIFAWLKTKFGFSLIILLPATFIILQELRTMRGAWRQLHPRYFSLAHASIIALPLLFLIAPIAYARLTTTATLINNSVSTVAVFPSPSPTPSASPTASPTPSPEISPSPSPSPSPEASPTPSPTPNVEDNCSLDVNVDVSNTNTGPGSTNTNTVDIDHDCTVTKTTATTITNDITIDATTGGNEQSGNTDTGSLSTGDVNLNLNIQNQN